MEVSTWTHWPSSGLLYSFRFLASLPDENIGILLGNYFNTLGTAGQLLTILAMVYHLLVMYFRIRMVAQKELPFFDDIVDYDDQRKTTILTGEYREKVVKLMAKGVKVLK